MRVIVIGGATAGMGMSAKLRRNLPDVEIVVYQKEKYVSLGACGLPYFVGDNFDDPNLMIARTIPEFEKAKIEIHTQSLVTGVDFKAQRIFFLDHEGNESFDNYDHLVIGTGAKPLIPDFLKTPAKNVFTLTRLEDGLKLKEYLQMKSVKNVAILGSGFIGLELCETLGKLGKNVYLIEREKRLAPGVIDPEFSDKIETELIKNKIKILKNNSITKLITTQDQLVKKVKLKSGEEIKIDALVLGIGFTPATDFLKDTALKLNDRGAIVVNDQGQTNIKNVWSCGDCATTPHRLTKQDTYTALATVPRKFSKIIADNIAGDKQKYAGTLQTAIIRIFDLEIARTGFSENEAKSLGYDFQTTLIHDKDQTDYVNGQGELSLKLVMDNKTKTLIGAQIIGHNHAVMRIHSLVAMIWNQTKVDHDLEQIDFPYAPPFSRPVDIIHLALSKLTK